ncbi:MAG: DUF3833 family protein [Alphaproteobacteria bacterium]|nr:MAG: DUF3833 family protein [Alphaproteobacteria bacterium]
MPHPPPPLATTPLRLERFFAGQVQCHGWFEDRFGRIRRRMAVTVEGHWDGHTLTLDEHFRHDDGSTDHRVWRLVPEGRERYRADTDGLVGPAIGMVDATSFRMRYRLRLSMGRHHLTVAFDDWMQLQTEDVLLNRSTITKFGIRLGTVCLVFTRRAAAVAEATAPADAVAA